MEIRNQHDRNRIKKLLQNYDEISFTDKKKIMCLVVTEELCDQILYAYINDIKPNLNIYDSSAKVTKEVYESQKEEIAEPSEPKTKAPEPDVKVDSDVEAESDASDGDNDDGNDDGDNDDAVEGDAGDKPEDAADDDEESASYEYEYETEEEEAETSD